MLDVLVTSKTRIKLILKFFLNPTSSSYLRGLVDEFRESSNAIRTELNRFEKAGLLKSENVGNKKIYKADTGHPLYKEINSIVRKTFGLYKIVEQIIQQLGNVQEAYITGDFAEGVDGPTIDIVLVGKTLKKEYLNQLIEKVEHMIKRRIRYLVLPPNEIEEYLVRKQPHMLIWKSE